MGGWAIFGQISGAVVVPATIKIDTERKTVQHLEGGIVDKIHVREGDKVVKGQPLVTLEECLGGFCRWIWRKKPDSVSCREKSL